MMTGYKIWEMEGNSKVDMKADQARSKQIKDFHLRETSTASVHFLSWWQTTNLLGVATGVDLHAESMCLDEMLPKQKNGEDDMHIWVDVAISCLKSLSSQSPSGSGGRLHDLQ